MPTRATRSDAEFFSTISCAIRINARRKSSRSRTTLSVSLLKLAPSWPLWTGLKEPTRPAYHPGLTALAADALQRPTMRVPDATREAIEIHQAAGRRFEAGGVQSFVRDQPPSVGT